MGSTSWSEQMAEITPVNSPTDTVGPTDKIAFDITKSALNDEDTSPAVKEEDTSGKEDQIEKD